MGKESFDYLLNGYISNNLTDDELFQFLELIKLKENRIELEEAIHKILINQPATDLPDEKRSDAIFHKVMEAAEAREQNVLEGRVITLKQRPKRYSFSK